ncbi:MAG: GspH/FimT family pseudopilin [Hydrogenophaga sp.]|nr:GspH/FimT family pseudopilin [Hydrogenophaga sp.]MDZ4187880.1 GspH/FimT family pseudopilin [Hydrogenophaga sp.]
MAPPANKITGSSKPLRGSSRQTGLTLIELMVVVAVSAILIAVAAPNLTDMATSAKLNSISDRWMAAANLARSEAIKRNRLVTLCASTDGSTCATAGGAQVWASGWLIGHTVAGTWTVIEQEAALASGYRLEVASGGTPIYSVVFQPTGVDSTTATAMVCRSKPSGNLQQRTIDLSITGRTQLSKAPRTTACPTS